MRLPMKLIATFALVIALSLSAIGGASIATAPAQANPNCPGGNC